MDHLAMNVTPTSQHRNRQRGVSLLFAMITVVALSLAAVAMIRSVDTGTTILGNGSVALILDVPHLSQVVSSRSLAA